VFLRIFGKLLDSYENEGGEEKRLLFIFGHCLGKSLMIHYKFFHIYIRDKWDCQSNDCLIWSFQSSSKGNFLLSLFSRIEMTAILWKKTIALSARICLGDDFQIETWSNQKQKKLMKKFGDIRSCFAQLMKIATDKLGTVTNKNLLIGTVDWNSAYLKGIITDRSDLKISRMG